MDFAKGDQVRRKQGRQNVGVVERLLPPRWPGDPPRVQVRWINMHHYVSAGRKDGFTRIALSSLVKEES